MDMHLVGGFLGSGKTTSIINAAKTLIAAGKKVGVVTNDKGKHLVDTAFFRSADIPTAEVAGGCFRCNYDQLEERLRDMEQHNQPDIIFAESVGSCADMAETVMKPLLDYQAGVEGKTSFSVYCDIRLLRFWLQGQELPFAEEIVYIFEQQLQEAPLIVINKSDLLPDSVCQEVLAMASERFPNKQLLLQSALQAGGTRAWLDIISTMEYALPEEASSTMDYDIYDAGSRKLAWLDESIQLIGSQVGDSLRKFIERFHHQIQEEHIAVGHVKFFVKDQGHQVKLSLPSLEEENWQSAIPTSLSSQVTLIVNGRMECAPAKINRLVQGALDFAAAETDVMYTREASAYFRPRVSPLRNSHMV